MIAADLVPLATPTADLHTMPGNPRRGNVEAVAASLKRFGQRKPIVATLDGTVIAGNHTFMAAQRLGWEEIACVRVDDDPRTADAFALADNRTSDLGSYDRDALVALLSPLAEDDPALLAATGYSAEDVANLLLDMEPVLPEPGDAEIEDIPFLWGVIIETVSEEDQAELLERFAAEGLKVRALMG